MKRYVLDTKVMEIDAPDDLTDEEIIEGYNVGDIEGYEVDGRIEMEPVDELPEENVGEREGARMIPGEENE